MAVPTEPHEGNILNVLGAGLGKASLIGIQGISGTGPKPSPTGNPPEPQPRGVGRRETFP